MSTNIVKRSSGVVQRLVIKPKAEQPNMRGLITEKEAAKYIGVCRLTLLHLRQRGALGFYRVGRSIKYSIEEHIDPFLARNHYNRKRKGAVRAE